MSTLEQQHTAAKVTAKRIVEINREIAKIGVSQRDIAGQAGIGQPHVNRVLRGHVRTPTFWTLLRIEQAVGYFARLVAAERGA
jgi:predicted transcriptional regulator